MNEVLEIAPDALEAVKAAVSGIRSATEGARLAMPQFCYQRVTGLLETIETNLQCGVAIVQGREGEHEDQ